VKGSCCVQRVLSGDQTTLHRNLEALKGDPFEEVYRAFVSAYERQGKLATAAGGKDWLIP
jgi:hypothetical protein